MKNRKVLLGFLPDDPDQPLEEINGTSQSATIDLGSYTKAIVYVWGNTAFTIEASPNGTDWGEFVASQVPSGLSLISTGLDPCPGLVRIDNTGATPLRYWVDGMREVA